jgi:transcriptional regulator with XRE-family HTH domain
MTPSPRFYALGVRLRLWRTHLNLSQTEMAKIAGMNQPNESKIESGKQFARSEHIAKWAEAAGVTPEAILNTDPPSNPSPVYHFQTQTGDNIAHQTVQQGASDSNTVLDGSAEYLKQLEVQFKAFQQQIKEEMAALKAYSERLEASR